MPLKVAGKKSRAVPPGAERIVKLNLETQARKFTYKCLYCQKVFQKKDLV